MRTKLHPKRPLGIAVATGGIYNAARKRYDLQPTHYKSLDKPLEHFNDNDRYARSISMKQNVTLTLIL